MNGPTELKTHRPSTASSSWLSALTPHIDRHLVLELGGEFLTGSGFEQEIPDLDFEEEGESDV